MRIFPLLLGVGLLWATGCEGEAKAKTVEVRYRVILEGFEERRTIDVIKAVRAVTGLGLADAKRIVDDIPAAVLEGQPLKQARLAIAALEEAGGRVELRAE